VTKLTKPIFYTFWVVVIFCNIAKNRGDKTDKTYFLYFFGGGDFLQYSQKQR